MGQTGEFAASSLIVRQAAKCFSITSIYLDRRQTVRSKPVGE
jgi:hypothetical protein